LLIVAASLTAAFQTAKQPQPAKPRPAQSRPANPVAEAIRKNNLGAAFMNQQRMEQALAQFREARSLDPKLSVALLNEGIALLNLQRTDAARKVLLEASQKLPENPRVWYNLGLLYKSAGETDASIDAFVRAAKLAPGDANVHYFLGTLHAQAQRYDDAITAYERALQLNRFHASAEFGLSRAWQRKGNAEESRKHMARFQHISQEKLGSPMSLAYGDQGELSLAEDVRSTLQLASRPVAPKFMQVPGSQSGLRLAKRPYRLPGVEKTLTIDEFSSAACALDHDNDGNLDVFITISEDFPGGRLFHNVGSGRFVDVTDGAGFSSMHTVHACAAGDFDNDGWTDLVVGGAYPTQLFRNRGDGSFIALAEPAFPTDHGFVGELRFFDLDHDGDLDLYITRTPREPDFAETFLRNNGNGTFTDQAASAGLIIEGSSNHFVVSDFDNDRAIDLLVGRNEKPPLFLFNQREGEFRRQLLWQQTSITKVWSTAVLDYNQDGWQDVALSSAEGATIWRNIKDRRFEKVEMTVPADFRATRIAPLDFDNNGWTDLAIAGITSKDIQIVVCRNRGEQFDPCAVVYRETLTLKLANRGIWDLAALDFDGDGDTDLLGTCTDSDLRLLRNETQTQNNFLRLQLKGLADNKSAIGTKVEVFAGASYQKFEITSPNDLLVGLGQEKQADIVRLLWPTGVLQDEIGLAANQRHVITEIDRRGSSCPILFAWNGSRFEFIADMIGPGIVGHWVAPRARNIPDPTEYLKVSGESVRPRDGKLHFRFLEPMEEVVYLDQVRLLAVDHPANSEVFPNERFAASPPLPEFKVIVSRDARPPAGAWDDRGRDILPELLHRDRRYVTGYEDAPYKGFAKTHFIELDLGESVAANPNLPLRLLMHGFTDYFTATSVYAAHQAGVTAIVPRVDALLPNAQWTRVSDDIGFPAGLARTMVADLSGKLPRGTRRVRITTNLKIYWDQILIDTTDDSPIINGEDGSFRLSAVPLDSAGLRFLGYPRELHGAPKSDLRYDYQTISATGPYARHAGNYTRYGDVRQLVDTVDDRFTILGSGDEVALAFDPQTLPPLPPGWKRDYFFFAHGYAKDMDFYAAYGYTVEPLPFGSMPHYPYAVKDGRSLTENFLNYLLDFNSRSESGRPPRSLRYAYLSRK
jgi:Flp pilus assembly protein TadD